MKIVPVEQTQMTLPELAEMAMNGPVILTRKGKPILSVKDLSGSDWESISLANNPQFLAVIEESRHSFREKGGIGLDDLSKELGLRKPKRPPSRKRKPLRENGKKPNR